MPDKRSHRGPHPEDHRWFAPAAWPGLREAVADLSWLLTRGYTSKSGLKIVGDRHGLTERQRIAVMRCAGADDALAGRRQRQVGVDALAGQTLMLDGYNVLTTIEAGLAGGVILRGRDGCLRDMASMHGTFRKVAETGPAVTLIGRALDELAVPRTVWYLDRPVSNSGRLRALIQQIADEHAWEWNVELVPDPDALLAATEAIVATADSVILDRCPRWVNLTAHVVRTCLPDANLVDLSISSR